MKINEIRDYKNIYDESAETNNMRKLSTKIIEDIKEVKEAEKSIKIKIRSNSSIDTDQNMTDNHNTNKTNRNSLNVFKTVDKQDYLNVNSNIFLNLKKDDLSSPSRIKRIKRHSSVATTSNNISEDMNSMEDSSNIDMKKNIKDNIKEGRGSNKKYETFKLMPNQNNLIKRFFVGGVKRRTNLK